MFFEGSWVTLSSWVWFWHDFPEGVRSLEKQNLQFILANAFSSSELKKVYGIDGVPRNLVGMLLEQRGTKLCQRFSFLFLLLCFCFFVFVLFSVFDRLFIKCKYFSIGSGGAQVYLKKLIWCQGNADNSSKIGFLWLKLCSYFSREVMFDTLSYRRKSVPPCSSCCGFKTFRRRIGEKVKQKQDWSTPPSSPIPMHMVHRVTKAATFFWLVSLNFFLLLFSCLCTGMLRMVFFFSYFFFPFFCWFSFCMLFFC